VLDPWGENVAITRKNHFVLIPQEDGSVSIHPMKEWLRQNPKNIPPGCDPTESTSQQLRAGLKRLGWTLQETEREFRLLPPGTDISDSPLINEILEPDIGDIPETTEETAFGLEYQLRDFLAQNLAAIPVLGRRLRVYVDPTGRDGIEFPTAVGPIDLLAVDEAGDFYVFELKRGRTPDYTVGQLMRYMGWISQTIGKAKRVNGLVVAKQISETLRYAICVVPNVSLFEYEVSFQLHAASSLAQHGPEV